MSQDRTSTVDHCQTVLISDRIATEDAFRHREVSHAIAQMIAGNEGGCAIALTGSWGSGKSTVVSLLASELKETKRPVQTFIFDAWAHQGDPLRRTFLEKLIEWCTEELEWAEKTRWNSDIEELAKRKEVVETRSSPHLGGWGIAGALSLLISPVALQIYQKVDHKLHPVWEAFALLLSALTFIVALALWAWWSIKGRRTSKGERKPLPNLIFTSTENTTISKGSKTPDPTSVEFEKKYQELLDEVLSNNERRILLVIDNLDRVRHEDALSIWATLRIFLDPPTKSQKNWWKRVWVLVPFDPEAISNLWDAGQSSSDGGNNGNSTNGHTAASRHFLEKTFQATFRVPPVILTNWENYLLEQLRTAFPDSRHTEDEFRTIFRLYDRLAVPETRSPTPRNLKIFVNALGALHAQWPETIPLPDQAAFVLLNGNETDGAIRTVMTYKPASPSDVHLALDVLLKEDWPRNLAALHFNVLPEDAYQVLLSQPITNALWNGRADELAALAKKPGFDDALEKILEKIMPVSDDDSRRIANSAIALAGLPGECESKVRCQNYLSRASCSVSTWSPFDASIASGIKELVIAASDGRIVKRLIESVCNSLNLNYPTSGNPRANISNWCAGIATLLPVFAERHDAMLRREFKVKFDAPIYFNILDEMRNHALPDPLWKYLQPTVPAKSLIDFLAQRAQAGVWVEWEQQSVLRLMKILDVDVAPLIAGLQSRIVDYSQPVPNDVPLVLETLIDLATRDSKNRAALENPTQGEALIQLTSQFAPAGNHKAVALCTLPLLTSGIPMQQTQNPAGWQQNTPLLRLLHGKQLFSGWFQNPASCPALDQLAERCLSWRTFAEWREISMQKPDRAPLVWAMISKRFKQAKTNEIDASEIVTYFDLWSSKVERADLDRILQEKVASGELAQCLQEHSFDLKLIQLYVLALSEDGNHAYRQFLIDALSGVTKDRWLVALSAETQLLDLALLLRTDGLKLRSAFQDALFEHFKSKLDQPAGVKPRSDWKDVIDLLGESDLSAFEQRLLSIFKSNSVQKLGGALPYYGPLVAQLVLQDGPEKSFEVVTQIIERRDKAELEWLTALVKEWEPASRQTKNICKNLSERVEEAKRKDVSEDIQRSLKELQEALNSKLGN